MELSLQGFGCSQVLALMGLEAQGKTAPDLVRAMAGLQNGLGCGKVCGTLSGACCVLGLYAGRGAPEETGDSTLAPMLTELVTWFEDTFGRRYGGIDCKDIVGQDPRLRLERCPEIVIATIRKVTEILEANNCAVGGQAVVGFP